MAQHKNGSERAGFHAFINTNYKKQNIMRKQNTTHDLEGLADDAQALLAATADVAGEKVSEARDRLASALEKTWGRVQEKAAQGAKATDECIREHPYQAIGIAFGVG